MNLIILLESNKSGLTFKFWIRNNWMDEKYQNSFLNLIFFHFFFFMFLWSLLRTIFTNPGEIDPEYQDIYSLVTFTKFFFLYLLEEKNPLSNTKKDDIEWILSKKSKIDEISQNYEIEIKK